MRILLNLKKYEKVNFLYSPPNFDLSIIFKFTHLSLASNQRKENREKD